MLLLVGYVILFRLVVISIMALKYEPCIIFNFTYLLKIKVTVTHVMLVVYEFQYLYISSYTDREAWISERKGNT